jgi:hypothetical protein
MRSAAPAALSARFPELPRLDMGARLPLPVRSFKGLDRSARMVEMDALADDRFLVRFHMALIFLATAGATVLASRLLYGGGIDRLTMRYALAVLLAYALFFSLVRLWILYVTRAAPSDPRRGLPDVRPRGGGGVRETAFRPGGGRFGGGGAGAHWDVEPDVPVVRSLAQVGRPKSSAGSSGASSAALDLDDGAVLFIVLVLLASVLGGVSIFLVWQTPIILPEAVFEVLLASGLIRSARRDDARGWSRGVLRATLAPFLLVLLAAALAGWAVQRACPSATGLADLLVRCP